VLALRIIHWAAWLLGIAFFVGFVCGALWGGERPAYRRETKPIVYWRA
jgi:hypothetical protein